MLLRSEFRLPGVVFLLLALGFAPGLWYLWIAAIALGLGNITRDSVGKLREGTYSLDYIAFLAMAVALPAEQYLAGAVVALMITGGEALDEYASRRAEAALRGLVERIPKFCVVRLHNGGTVEKPLQEVRSGECIVVKPGELVPLDGTLLSEEALLDESNLTGEALPVAFEKGRFVKSGVVNAGPTLELSVEGSFERSTYMRIVHLVDEARRDQPRVVRLAEQVNFPFTAVALLLALGAYFLTGELARALAVLVIATPCPLLIAAPVAFIGGLSRAARRNIIVKRPATLEEISRARVMFFDKTGTLTLGTPRLSKVEALADKKEDDLLSIAAAIEFHSIHPLARAIQAAATTRGLEIPRASAVVEKIGHGIEGEVRGVRYAVAKAKRPEKGGSNAVAGIVLSVLEGESEIGRVYFEDVMKNDVEALFRDLADRGVRAEILTGDRRENAERLFGKFGIPIRASQTPETKFAAIEEAKNKGASVIMVGDGLNDAPALAEASVGVVFSGTENSASIEAADAVILGHDVSLVSRLLETARRSVQIAKESVWGGIGLSVVGMVFASMGFIPPVEGAVLQEVIDVVVIVNSLRAALD